MLHLALIYIILFYTFIPTKFSSLERSQLGERSEAKRPYKEQLRSD